MPRRARRQSGGRAIFGNPAQESCSLKVAGACVPGLALLLVLVGAVRPGAVAERSSGPRRTRRFTLRLLLRRALLLLLGYLDLGVRVGLPDE